VVIATCTKWRKDDSKEVNWVIKHATRTLVKNGCAEVFPLLGFTENPQIMIEKMTLSNEVIKLGESVSFDFDVKSASNNVQNIVIDYAIYFVKANGAQQAKVFKLKNIKLKPKSIINLNKSFYFRPITTRKYYKGEHKIELLVNGNTLLTKDFIVE